LTPVIRSVVRQMNPALPVEIGTLADGVEERLSNRRQITAVVGIFGLLALALAALGLYGVMAYTVAQRVREVGVRIALGALPRDVLRLFVLDGARLTAAGLAIGGLLALATGRVIGSVLEGVSPLDPLTCGPDDRPSIRVN
jgi:ABC-type antimicrobial peptide transport system permease subunit